MKITVHTDGGARGNPGPAAIGVVIEQATIDLPRRPAGKQQVSSNKILLKEFGKRIGETTNNVAEYTAVVEALEAIKNLSIIKSSNNPIIQCYLDSTLVVNQLNGLFKIKEPTLRELYMQIKILEQGIDGKIFYEYVPREKNREADMLVNKALDEERA